MSSSSHSWSASCQASADDLGGETDLVTADAVLVDDVLSEVLTFFSSGWGEVVLPLPVGLPRVGVRTAGEVDPCSRVGVRVPGATDTVVPLDDRVRDAGALEVDGRR